MDVSKEGKMSKKINLYFLITLLVISIVYADRTCQDVQEANVPCQIVTPVIIGCSTYDLYNSTLELNIDDGQMSQIGSTGMYNFTFNQPDVGTHKGIICDNSTFTITVEDYSLSNIYIEAKNDTDVSNITVNVNTTKIAKSVWDYNLSENYPQADKDNYIAGLAGEQVLQALRFLIQLIFG